MHIQFIGATQTVTGSMHIVRTKHDTVLLDCGLYQGHRRESYERNSTLGVPVGEITAVILSHAHIDHSGAIPMLVKNGYEGPIYATPATRDLAAVMLLDSARIQEADADYLTRQARKERIDVAPLPPLYVEKDALRSIGLFHSVPYGFRTWLSPHTSFTFLDAGHVLGSAITLLDLEEDGRKKRLAFTGDLGRLNMPILEDPDVPDGVDVLVTESTYGDRLHDDIHKMEDDLAAVIKRTYDRGGKVIIPSFALERAQEVVFALKQLEMQGRLPRLLKVYVDSPLTVKITDVFKLHPECYDEETLGLISHGNSPFEFGALEYIDSVEDSKEVSTSSDPAVIIAASGMCEAGRVLHHLKACVEDARNTVLIVGYQAQHTLGRRLVENRDRVKIFGVERERRAEVVVLNGFSAHADQRDLVNFADQCRARGPVERIALVHGDPKPQKILGALLEEKGFAAPAIPKSRDTLEL
ncbi:MAG: MBL fold metallo-hydrolase [Myxococcales bacterium]|nr:MBL fold metallo-hydrolase [Myxococcales bacterium]